MSNRDRGLFSVLKWSEAIFWNRSSKPSVRSFYLCPFHWKARPSGVSSESLGLRNIPKLLEIEAELVKITLRVRWSRLPFLVLKWSEAIFRPKSSKPSVRSIYLCPFHWKARRSGVSLESLGLRNIFQVAGNQGKVGQKHAACKAVLAPFVFYS